MAKYKIHVKSFQNRVLTFSVDEYKVEDGFVKFVDKYTEKEKCFHGSNCEIEVIKDV